MSEEPAIPVDAASDPLLASLNDPQRAAVVHGDGPLLILAGAGSGKTRAITHRVAWLVERRQVPPWRILAVTFTNKAAAEMRERLQKLLGPTAADVHVSTFHAAGAAILRREAEKVGLTRSFVIYDDADQLQLLRRALSDCGIGDRIKPQLVRHRIDHAKNHALGPAEIEVAPGDFVDQGVQKAYFAYEKLLKQADAVDFGDLLLKVVQLFRKDPETLARYRQRFQYVLVDEFQDTNPVQYELLRLLCPAAHANLCVVGDDDQSIYRWRGADVANILSFQDDFPGTVIVKLERNYRSDAGILEAAYAVISQNSRRMEKKLWTDRPRGAPLQLILAPDERTEAQHVAQAIRAQSRQGLALDEVAVFYRANAQSRVLEEGMRLASIPYHVVRGRAFYDRAEIKDAASYLRLAVNPRSDADLERVINTPQRGIGDTTVDRLRAFAAAQGMSLFEALKDPARIPDLNAGAQRRLAGFCELVEQMQVEVAQASDARSGVDRMLALSQLVLTHEAEGSEEGNERAENLREFAGAASEFDRLRATRPETADASADDRQLKPPQGALEAFLEQVSLLGDADAQGVGGRVSLMTLHAAKGLEFDSVFLTGMEENVFPHARSISDEGSWQAEEMAEERRLCYVGITRARRQLTFSLAGSRALFGELKRNPPSRFLGEVPRELFAFAAPAKARPQKERLPGESYVERDADISLDASDGFGFDEFDQRPPHERRSVAPMRRRNAKLPVRPSVPQLEVGARVVHDSFGEGFVTASSGGGANATVTVQFETVGEKRIVARFLRLLV